MILVLSLLVFEFFSKHGVWLIEQICMCQQREICFSWECCDIRTSIALSLSNVSTGDACRHHKCPTVKPQAPQSALSRWGPGESRTFSQLTWPCRPTVGKVWVHCGQGEASTNPTWAPCWLAHSSFALWSSHQGFPVGNPLQACSQRAHCQVSLCRAHNNFGGS